MDFIAKNANRRSGQKLGPTEGTREGPTMYSYAKRMKVVKLYIQHEFIPSAVMHELGYPKNRHTLYAWYKEY